MQSVPRAHAYIHVGVNIDGYPRYSRSCLQAPRITSRVSPSQFGTPATDIDSRRSAWIKRAMFPVVSPRTYEHLIIYLYIHADTYTHVSDR